MSPVVTATSGTGMLTTSPTGSAVAGTVSSPLSQATVYWLATPVALSTNAWNRLPADGVGLDPFVAWLKYWIDFTVPLAGIVVGTTTITGPRLPGAVAKSVA